MFCSLAFLTIFLAAYYLPQNAGAIARKYIQDPQLLSFIDAEVDRCNYLFDSVRSFKKLLRKMCPDEESLLVDLMYEVEENCCGSHCRN